MSIFSSIWDKIIDEEMQRMRTTNLLQNRDDEQSLRLLLHENKLTGELVYEDLQRELYKIKQKCISSGLETRLLHKHMVEYLNSWTTKRLQELSIVLKSKNSLVSSSDRSAFRGLLNKCEEIINGV